MYLKLCVLTCALLVTSATWSAEIGPGDDLRAAIDALGPGDELVLRGGEYALNSGFRIGAVGTESQPVIIRGKAGERAVIRQYSSNHNTIEVTGSRYLVLDSLVVTGGSHGIRLMDSDYITIQSCEVFETGDVAISANSGGTYTGLKILRNHIHHTNNTGEGMYLGCNNDQCRVENSLIEGNYVHHTNGPTVEQGDGIELKEGSSGNTIRDNVIHDTNYPGILVYGTAGNGPANTIEGNVIWNVGDYGIQAAADAIIRNNIVLDGGVGFQRHQSSVPSNIEFVHNTVLLGGTTLTVRDVSGPVVIANNALYSQGGNAVRLVSGDLSQVVLRGNVGTGGVSGASGGFTWGAGVDQDFVNGHFGVPPIDLYPSAGSPLIDAGDAAYQTPVDFNGASRSGVPDAGAYQHGPDSNQGWPISTTFKTAAGITIPLPPVILED